MNQQLQKLSSPARCGLAGMRPCNQPAHWQVLNSAQGPQVAVCDLCIVLMSDMNDDNQGFFQPALDEIAWRYERRRLFMSLMRRPEMKLVRAALHQLKWDEKPDWRAITEIEVSPYGLYDDCCMITCGTFMLVCLDVNAPAPHFIFLWLHDEENANCPCEFCETDRRAA